MEPSNSPELVKFADNLIFEKIGIRLKDKEQEILQQVLEGKLHKQLRYGDYSNDYIKKGIVRDIWKLLSQATGKKVGKKNVQPILEKLWKEQSNSEAVPQLIPSNGGQPEHNGHAALNGKTSAETSNFVKLDQLRQCSCHNLNCTHAQNPAQADDILWRLNEQLSEFTPGKQADEERSQEAEEPIDLGSSIPQSDTAEATDTQELNWQKFIKFIKPGVPLLLAVGILGCGFVLSWLANWYGVTNHLAGNQPKAQFFYFLAHKLNSLSPSAHYNQGVAYEDQQNYPRAHTEYQLAIEGGLIEAYNNQARLYILEKNYDSAVSLLNIGLPLAKDDRVKSDMYKNRGWARLEQGYYAQAKTDLEAAIQLKSERAPAHCLLAQVLEQERNPKGALIEWERCLGFAYQTNLPEEDRWIHLASQRLDAKRSKE